MNATNKVLMNYLMTIEDVSSRGDCLKNDVTVNQIPDIMETLKNLYLTVLTYIRDHYLISEYEIMKSTVDKFKQVHRLYLEVDDENSFIEFYAQYRSYLALLKESISELKEHISLPI